MTTLLQDYLIPRPLWDTSRTGEGTSRVSLRAVWLREGRKAAFTLAEVLITLGIIGVVAAMTIPNLIANYQKTRDVNILKNQYAELSQAFRAASQEHDLYSSTPAEIVEALKPHVKYSGAFENSDGDFAARAMCYNPSRKYWGGRKVKRNSTYQWWGGCGVSTPITYVKASIELNNGACIGFSARNHQVILDTNGSYTLPNTVGKDVFIYEITSSNGLMPYGMNLDYNRYIVNGSNACTKTINTCGGGTYCAARIMHDGWQINYY
ncbi:MAG: type II secretion system GspH family protein [Muribaculaceae bacterium]|nr:type II secretion system GspH family protein [Muribaculaceae bacterium]